MRYIMIVGWKTCDLQLTFNWLNQNIKSLSNVKFQIKSQNLNMFQLHKKWEMGENTLWWPLLGLVYIQYNCSKNMAHVILGIKIGF
jgi:hypothetical protein